MKTATLFVFKKHFKEPIHHFSSENQQADGFDWK
jgi:hypothetical protein